MRLIGGTLQLIAGSSTNAKSGTGGNLVLTGGMSSGDPDLSNFDASGGPIAVRGGSAKDKGGNVAIFGGSSDIRGGGSLHSISGESTATTASSGHIQIQTVSSGSSGNIVSPQVMPLRMIAGSYKFAQEIQLKDRVAPLLYLSDFPKERREQNQNPRWKYCGSQGIFQGWGCLYCQRPGESMADVGGKCGNPWWQFKG